MTESARDPIVISTRRSQWKLVAAMSFPSMRSQHPAERRRRQSWSVRLGPLSSGRSFVAHRAACNSASTRTASGWQVNPKSPSTTTPFFVQSAKPGALTSKS